MVTPRRDHRHCGGRDVCIRCPWYSHLERGVPLTLTPLINFDDAVTAANLNPNQKFAVYYADGHYANRTAVSIRCPQAKLFGITVWGETGPGIFACDSETGDLDVPQTLAWVERQIQLKVDLICVYANLNRWLHEGLLAGVVALEKKYGVKVRKWVAFYNNVPLIQPWADAEQYADPGPVDHNVALANFFGTATPPPPPPDPKHYDWFYTGPFPSKLWGNVNERLVVEQYDGAVQHPVRYAAYILVLRLKLRWLANRVAAEAGAGTSDTTWDLFHRGWRFQALIHRAQGQKV